jgi:ubiquinone/menaquinone biosynthesis C-methylase UbiE
MNKAYVHGYDSRENLRLQDQASTPAELLHADTSYPPGSRVLEAGGGVGSQTVTLARNSPKSLITSIDISRGSLTEAKRKVTAAGLTNVHFQQADTFNLPFVPKSFDHIFICFVLERLSRPVEALSALKRLLRTGGTKSDSVPGGTAATRRRKRHDRESALSPVAQDRVHLYSRLSPNGLR